MYVLTTKHLPVMKTVTSRSWHKTQDKPACVVDYITNMAGMDRCDQVISDLPLHGKALKWWKKLVSHLVTLAMIQAHSLYNIHLNQHKRKVKLEAFVRSVCTDLARLCAESADEEGDGAVASAPAAGAAALSGEDVNGLQLGTPWPQPQPSGPGLKHEPQKACVVFYARMVHRGATRHELKRKQMPIQCEQCQKLCV